LGVYTPRSDLRGDLIFDHAGFYYEDDEENVLEDISFHCKPGQVVALLGSTGSGKTTLVNLLPRFYDYTSGRILLDNVELTRYPRRYPAPANWNCRAGALPFLALHS
jgi:ATP-binding cassette, subfamily B, bacterial